MQEAQAFKMFGRCGAITVIEKTPVRSCARALSTTGDHFLGV